MFNLESLGQLALSALFLSLKPTLLTKLQDLYTSNPHDYKAAIFVLIAGIERFKKVVETSTTKLDDTLLADIQQIITESAAQNNVTL